MADHFESCHLLFTVRNRMGMFMNKKEKSFKVSHNVLTWTKGIVCARICRVVLVYSRGHSFVGICGTDGNLEELCVFQ